MITKEQKQEIVAKYGKDANDTGSASTDRTSYSKNQ